MKIRKAEQDDVDELAVLFDNYRVFYKQSSNTEAARQFLRQRFTHQDSTILIATTSGIIIGFTQLYPTFSSVTMQSEYILNDLFVSREFRNQGVGKMLLDAAKALVVRNNMKGLHLSTALDNPAKFLYEKEGWIKDEEFLHYYWRNVQADKHP